MDDKTLKHWASGPLCTITQAAALLGVSSQTVSYTHLDVYKRQVQSVSRSRVSM